MTLAPSTLALITFVFAFVGLALLGLGVACGYGFAAIRRTRSALAVAETQIGALRREVEAATAVAVRAGERLRKLEQATGQMGERLGQLELRGEGRPYDQAIALVQRGADADRLVRNFGLSRGEADLVALVHGRRKAS